MIHFYTCSVVRVVETLVRASACVTAEELARSISQPAMKPVTSWMYSAPVSVRLPGWNFNESFSFASMLNQGSTLEVISDILNSSTMKEREKSQRNPLTVNKLYQHFGN